MTRPRRLEQGKIKKITLFYVVEWAQTPSSFPTVSFQSDNGIASFPFSLSLSSLYEAGRPKTAIK
jgi:hypothetical protein